MLQLSIYKGDDKNFTMTFTDKSVTPNRPFDLTGCTVYFMLKKRFTDPDSAAVLDQVYSNISSPTLGKVPLAITKVQSEALAIAEYPFDIRLKRGTGAANTIAVGSLDVQWNVRRSLP